MAKLECTKSHKKWVHKHTILIVKELINTNSELFSEKLDIPVHPVEYGLFPTVVLQEDALNTSSALPIFSWPGRYIIKQITLMSR